MFTDDDEEEEEEEEEVVCGNSSVYDFLLTLDTQVTFVFHF
jgi:hypothetical protein